MEYEDKLTELQSKYTGKTRQSFQKKLKAKNQIAEFVEEEDEEFSEEFEELMDYKYGASKWKNYHFENEASNLNYSFCENCDDVFRGSLKNHEKVCKYRELTRVPLCYMMSLDRIGECLMRVTSQESNDLKAII
jgi:hypothetical protein